MKKKHLFCLFYLFPFFLFSQNVERILQTTDIHTIVNDEDEFEGGKRIRTLVLNENENKIILVHTYFGKQYEIDLENFSLAINCSQFQSLFGGLLQFDDIAFGAPNKYLQIQTDSKVIKDNNCGAGISFILKIDNIFTLFFVHENGTPRAINAEGKTFNNYETMELLKSFDVVKFNKSLEYAKSIGLEKQFLNSEVLIWGNIYYNTYRNLYKFWNSQIYFSNYGICYDLGDYSYQTYIESTYSKIIIVNNNTNRKEYTLSIENCSEIFNRELNNNSNIDITSESVVGLSGNIFFFISDTEETEVFRIRNTWDSTNLYALAINGYTEDFYGDYVKEVLPKMSKADLRLLRNTIFALYGVHFKSEDLAKHFDKQVWYTDKGLISGDVTLPAHRQKLVEMIQKLEK